MLSIDEALDVILGTVSPLGAERVALDAALGRVLAEAMIAREAAPPFDASAMDGWAVRAEDLAGVREGAPIALPIAGESRAGGEWPAALAPGHAMRIFTGAPVPEGADTVVMQEEVERLGDAARFARAPGPGSHIRRRGEDVVPGVSLLAAGGTIGSGEIALLASQGIASVAVSRAPRVAILVNGDELREPGEPARAGTIFDSNGPSIAAAVREAGGVPLVLPRAPDRLDAIAQRIREGLRADALVVCGGVSVGEHDLVHRALEDAGVSPRFWKVKMKPGKPLTFGVAGATPVFGLPGNPVSAWVTFELFVRPALRVMAGDARPFRPRLEVELAAPHRHAPGRIEFARARLEWRGARPSAHVAKRQGSGSIPSVAGVDALVILPAERETFAAGDAVSAISLRSTVGAERAPISG